MSGEARGLSLLISKLAIAAVGLLWVVGCSSEQYRYVPQDATAPNNEARPEPSGSVRVASMGIVELKPKNGSKNFSALHLRMTISNQSPNLWLLNTGEELVSLADQPAMPPTFVNSNSPIAPQLNVNPGELRTVDLYYRLPDGKDSPKDVAEFNFNWRIRAGETPIQETTQFARIRAYPEYAVASPYYGPY
jgi:hypothetical protein